jgi:hypothetical protein
MDCFFSGIEKPASLARYFGVLLPCIFVEFFTVIYFKLTYGFMESPHYYEVQKINYLIF